MTDQNPDKIADAHTEYFFNAYHNCQSLQDVDRLFDTLRVTLTTPVFDAIIDRVETQLSHDLRNPHPEVKRAMQNMVAIADLPELARSLKETFALKLYAEEVSFEPQLRLLSKIADFKGENASPEMKVFAQEAATLKAEQLGQPVEQARLLLAVNKKILAAQPSAKQSPKPGNAP